MQIEAERLEAAAAALLVGMGATESTASTVARSLVAADLRGHHAHGVRRLSRYADRIEAGAIDPEATPRVETATGTTARVDGRTAFGQVVGREAVRLLAERAEESHVGVVGLRDAADLGRIGEWAERVSGEGLCFAAFVNSQGGSHLVAPPGTTHRRLSANPVAFGIPTFDALEFEIVFDATTSQGSPGGVERRADANEGLPDGWAVDHDASSLTDAEAFTHGRGGLLPLGGRGAGHKGAGLAVVAELLAGILGEGGVLGQRGPDHANNAAAFVAVDPLAFTDRVGVIRRVKALVDHLDATDYDIDGDDRFLLPGEPEHESASRYGAEGVPVDDDVVAELRALGDELDVTVELPE